MTATRAEICALACAEAWRGDGEIVASGMGTIPSIGARLARASFAPDLLVSDGEAAFGAGTWAVDEAPSVLEGSFTYREVFTLLWSGRRHVMMGASQLDRFGNSNISEIGDYRRPTSQLLGVRGGPGNTINHPTSYWIPRHSSRVFVDKVDMASGVGYDRAAVLPGAGGRFHELRRVITDLAVLDFDSPDRRLRLASLHPGVELQTVIEATGFELVVDDRLSTTPEPDDEQLRLIREVIDPRNTRSREVKT